MSKMNEFLKDCLSLSYKSNSQDNPYHENQVEDLLKKYGLDYIAQPNGIQASPDFLVNYKGKEYPIECKSAKGHYPVYNGGLPKKGVIYVFSSKKYNKTTVFRSEDIVTDEKRKLYEDMLDEMKAVHEKYKSMEGWDDNRGFDFYIRAMYTQAGGKLYTDYFLHEDRDMCESNVINGEYD